MKKIYDKQGRPYEFDELYEKEGYEGLKEEFIDYLAGNEENTIKSVRRTLAKAARLEREWNKDLCEFSMDELDKLWGHLNAGTISSLLAQHNIIKQYIEYANSNKNYNTNPLRVNYAEMFKIEDLERYVNKIRHKKKIIDRDDVIEIVNMIDSEEGNAQDYAPLILNFIGVWGNGLEELMNLKVDDIDFDNKSIKLTKDNGDERIIKNVDSLFLRHLKYAAEETTYKRSTTNLTYDVKDYELIESPYLLKKYDRKDSEGLKVNQQTIRRRFARIKKLWGNEYISPTSVLFSGMIEYVKGYLKEKGLELDELITSDYEHIAVRFGKSKKTWFNVKRDITNYFKTK